tara:strand:+ start:1143 stop:2126 length:984 start_codon:yes stop_codon:yes gene_type:complete
LSETLADIGEIEILNRLKKFMDIGQIDDDTALIRIPKKDLVVNTDVLVENVHFTTSKISAKDIGWKAITTNLSDLAASGANGKNFFTVGLIAPNSTKWEWVEGVYEGMQNALNEFGGKLIGGDCSKGKEKILSITAISSLGPLQLHRSHSHPGDCLVTTGPHGLSKLGLSLINSESSVNLDLLSSCLKLDAINKHLRPYPPIQTVRQLEACKPKSLPWRAAGTDSSDGLVEAIAGLCRSSKCQAVLYKEQLPKHKDWPKGTKWDNWCLFGGEDYELVFSLPEEWANEWLKIVPKAKKIGFMQKGNPEIIWENNQVIINSDLTNFRHF